MKINLPEAESREALAGLADAITAEGGEAFVSVESRANPQKWQFHATRESGYTSCIAHAATATECLEILVRDL